METNIEEIWSPAHEFEGIYEVSNLGRVKSLSRWESRNHNGKPTKGITVKEKILNPGICAGYYKVTLVKNGILHYRLIHRLVMSTFEGPSEMQVDHNDEDKLNNRLSNLRYATCRKNHEYYNERRKSTRTSKYIGVNYSPTHKRKWRAGISINGKSTHIGYFDSEIDAAKAYQQKRMEVDAL